jgi:hypothetical protein
MNFVYIDESGNTGLNLKDPQQPVFVLAAMVMSQAKWFPLEREFFRIASECFSSPLPESFHIQAKDLKSGRGVFSQLTFREQLSFRDRILHFMVDSELVVIYRRIIKSKFDEFCKNHYGPGIRVNPYITALPFVCMEVDHYLQHKSPDELGMLIFDEQKDLEAAELSLKTLSLDSASILKTERIVEKGFFIDSKKSYAIQLVDLAAYYIRKYEEFKLGFRVSRYDEQTFDLVKKLTSTGVGSNVSDILEWVKNYWIK